MAVPRSSLCTGWPADGVVTSHYSDLNANLRAACLAALFCALRDKRYNMQKHPLRKSHQGVAFSIFGHSAVLKGLVSADLNVTVVQTV